MEVDSDDDHHNCKGDADVLPPKKHEHGCLEKAHDQIERSKEPAGWPEVLREACRGEKPSKKSTAVVSFFVRTSKRNRTASSVGSVSRALILLSANCIRLSRRFPPTILGRVGLIFSRRTKRYVRKNSGTLRNKEQKKPARCVTHTSAFARAYNAPDRIHENEKYRVVSPPQEVVGLARERQLFTEVSPVVKLFAHKRRENCRRCRRKCELEEDEHEERVVGAQFNHARRNLFARVGRPLVQLLQALHRVSHVNATRECEEGEHGIECGDALRALVVLRLQPALVVSVRIGWVGVCGSA